MSDKSKIYWNDVMEDCLVNGYLDAVGPDKKVNWAEVVKNTNDFLREAGIQVTVDKDQVNSKFQKLREDYKVFKSLSELSGAGWDYEANLPELSEAMWADLLDKPNSKYKRYKNKKFRHFAKFEEIIGNHYATGKVSQGPKRTASDAEFDSAYDSYPEDSANEGISSSSTPDVPRLHRAKKDPKDDIGEGIVSYLKALSERSSKEAAIKEALAQAKEATDKRGLDIMELVKLKQHLAADSGNSLIFLSMSEEERDYWIASVLK